MTSEWERAVRRGDLGALKRLAAAGADLNARDGHGQTALMVAAHEGQDDVVRWLVERGAALNHTARFGLSALMLAVIRGDSDIVQILVDAGADLTLKGTGAPGFDGKTALDLAVARDATRSTQILHAHGAPWNRFTHTPYFVSVPTWDAARPMLEFDPAVPRDSAGEKLEGFRIHVRDHTKRELTPAERTLEAHYERFVFSQAWRGRAEARRLALDTSYGPAPQETRIRGLDAKVYELGPEVPPEDIDGRMPSVVAWAMGEVFCLLASSQLTSDVLVRIAGSVDVPGVPGAPA